ncbi:MAG TPA: hypothetical protein VK171_15385 [Fimbriimonas sp.]|nr:hypothetical protein [Fimbriimonas sp.]
MQPPKKYTPNPGQGDPVSPKMLKSSLVIASVVAVIWLAVIGTETLQSLQKGAPAKAAFGAALLLGEIGSYSYVMYRGLVHQELADAKWHRIGGWVLTAGALYFLLGWKV